MNDVVPNKDLRMLIVFAITLLVIFIIKAGLNYFMQYWGHVVGVRMQGDMRSYVFTHLQKLPNSYFNNNKTGVIMSRIINDLMEVSELAHHGPEDLFIYSNVFRFILYFNRYKCRAYTNCIYNITYNSYLCNKSKEKNE